MALSVLYLHVFSKDEVLPQDNFSFISDLLYVKPTVLSACLETQFVGLALKTLNQQRKNTLGTSKLFFNIHL